MSFVIVLTNCNFTKKKLSVVFQKIFDYICTGSEIHICLVYSGSSLNLLITTLGRINFLLTKFKNLHEIQLKFDPLGNLNRSGVGDGPSQNLTILASNHPQKNISRNFHSHWVKHHYLIWHDLKIIILVCKNFVH